MALTKPIILDETGGRMADGIAAIVTLMQAKVTKIETVQPTVLEDNTIYNLSNVSSMALSYPSTSFDCIVNMTTAASGTITITFPASVYQPVAPAFGNGETWTLWIRNNPVGTGGMVMAQKAVSE